jgi:glycosyltransferase involved in cell wall biosynthesis
MKVSIVMPAYNRGYIIAEALESALAQSYRDIEILVVDDGSNDDTGEIVKGFRDPRGRYLRHARNSGCGAAYNTGFAASRGELLSILDSDDVWKPHKLECEVAFLVAHPEGDAVFSDLEKFDGKVFTPSLMRATPAFSKRLAPGVGVCQPKCLKRSHDSCGNPSLLLLAS